MTKQTVLVLGASSDIALATAHRFARGGYEIQLAARKLDNMERDARDIALRHEVNVTLHEFDVLDGKSHKQFIEDLPCLPNVAICCVGKLGDQSAGSLSSVEASNIVRTNFEGPASIIEALANSFEKRGDGLIVGISSVAGDRGRASNYVYGSAKAGFTAYLSGLRNRLARSGVHVLTVKPGFVRTKMTEHLKLPTVLTCSPEEIADAIFHASKSRKNVLYYKTVWSVVMLIIKLIPERFFKLTNL